MRYDAGTKGGCRGSSFASIWCTSGTNPGRLKRVFDITLAVVGLILAAPLMATIAVLIWLESPGNFIFAQERLGQHGRYFWMYKFRKFPVHWKDEGPGVTVAFDARMTRIGRIIEKLKFDELPQLWNILKGEMSFVGPRPESARFADLFVGKYETVLRYMPGIFGPSQVMFRNEGELYPCEENPESYYRRVLFPQKAESDLAYFQTANILSDVWWIIRGVWASFIGIVNWGRTLRLQGKLILADVVTVILAWTLAHILRFSGIPEGCGFEAFTTGLWLFPLLLVVGMVLRGCYNHPVRFFSLVDVSRMVCTVSVACLGSFLILLGQQRGISIYLLPIFWLIILPALSMPRIVSRIRYEKKCSSKDKIPYKIALYGAEPGGITLAKWIGNGTLIGFFDDSSALRGRHIHGYSVLGRESDIPTVYQVKPFGELWVTFTPDMQKRERLENICAKYNIKLFIIPDLEPFSGLIKGTGEEPGHCAHVLPANWRPEEGTVSPPNL